MSSQANVSNGQGHKALLPNVQLLHTGTFLGLLAQGLESSLIAQVLAYANLSTKCLNAIMTLIQE